MKARIGTFLFGASILGLSNSAIAETKEVKPTQKIAAKANPLQQALSVTRFEVGEAACDLATLSGSVGVSAKIQLSKSQAEFFKAYVPIEIIVNNVSIGSFTYAINDQGAVFVGRRVPIKNYTGKNKIQYKIGDMKSAINNFDHNCLKSTSIADPSKAKQVFLPDLGFGNYVRFVQFTPYVKHKVTVGYLVRLTPLSDETREAIRKSKTLEVTNFNERVPLFNISRDICPNVQDAYVSFRIYVEMKHNGADPSQYLNEGLFKSEYEEGAPWDLVPGVGLLTTKGIHAGENDFPQNKDFYYFDRTLPCTNDGVLEIRLDPDNKLKESDESNNVLRLRYATAGG